MDISKAGGGEGTICTRRVDGYRIMEKNDGRDYWDLFLRFRSGLVVSHQFGNAVKARDVYLLEDGGQRFILKWDRTGWGFGGEGAFERFFWRAVRGPFYSRLMRRVERARGNGCDRCQELLLVAERRTLHFCHEAVVILEYLEGETLEKFPDLEQHLAGVKECLVRLHSQALALCDVNLRNFIVTADGVKALDLVCRGNPRIDRIKDVIRAKKVLGIELPVGGVVDRACLWLMRAFQVARSRHVERKKKRRPLHRGKYFRGAE